MDLISSMKPGTFVRISLLLAALFCLPATWPPRLLAQTPSSGSEYVTYGGHHEFGALIGYSPVSGPVWGYDQNVRYSPMVLRYSFLVRSRRRWALRYAPEVTALSILHERAPSTTNPAAPVTHFGAGISPEGFQVVLRPGHRVQPFWSNAGGFIYYADRVLSPQGSQFMYTIDFGAGVNLFTAPRNALTLGFRYQHLSNANISYHNPGTDADTFYIGFSHFHTRGRP